MGWQIRWDTRPWETVDGNQLKQYASTGQIAADTLVYSLTKNKAVRAGDIAGLFAKDDFWESLPPPQPQVPDWISQFRSKKIVKKPRAGLLDVRFQAFLTPELVSLAWQIALWIIALCCMTQIIFVIKLAPLSQDVVIKSLQIIGAVCVTLAGGGIVALVVRVGLEAIVVLFKIEEHLRK